MVPGVLVLAFNISTAMLLVHLSVGSFLIVINCLLQNVLVVFESIRQVNTDQKGTGKVFFAEERAFLSANSPSTVRQLSILRL